MSVLLVLFMLAVVPSSPKDAWELTLDERIALRSNGELARQRVAEGKQMQTQSASSHRRPLADRFDGKTHPELFLPHEVFGQLISIAFEGDARTAQIVHEGLMPEVKRYGLPADFWERLESLSAVYTADHAALKAIGVNARAIKQKDLCRSRAEALAAARREFGRERFDRFLYEVIAVNMHYVADRLLEPEAMANIEAGCR